MNSIGKEHIKYLMGYDLNIIIVWTYLLNYYQTRTFNKHYS